MDKYQHDDKCRWWDDEEFCTCGAIEIDRLEKQIAALSTDLTTARAAGREEGLREAAGIARLVNGMGNYDKACDDVADAILAAIPSPPVAEVCEKEEVGG